MSKTINTRLKLKYDTLANWTTVANTFIPLRGEMCVVEVPSDDTSGTATNPPTIIFKVGDGTTKFANLPWCSGYAADVYSWAKKSDSDFIAWAKTQITPDGAITAALLSGSGTNTVTLSTTKGGTTSTSSVTVNNVGYATNAGTANSATKATQDASGNTITTYYLPKANATSKGSATNPVYFDASGVAQPTTFQLNASVPSGAVFTDTKNTAGSTNSTSKLYLIGATEQGANPQTYSNSAVYVNVNTLHASGLELSNEISGTRLVYNLMPGVGLSNVVGSSVYTLQIPQKNGTFAVTSDITKSAVGLGDVVNAGRDSTPTANSSNYVTSGGVKTYVDNAVSTMSKLRYQVVDSLPTASASTMGIIYLVADTHGTGDNYDEYITIQSGTTYSWEKIGNTDVDLSGYAKLSGNNTWLGNNSFSNTSGYFSALAASITIGAGANLTIGTTTGEPMTFSSGYILENTRFNETGIVGNAVSGTKYEILYPTTAGTLALKSDITSALSSYLNTVGDAGTGDYVVSISKSGQTVSQSRASFSSLTIQGNGTTVGTYSPKSATTVNIKPGTNISVSATTGAITINGKSDTDIKSLAETQINTHSGVDKVGTVSGMAFVGETGTSGRVSPETTGTISLTIKSTSDIITPEVTLGSNGATYDIKMNTSTLVLTSDEVILDCGSSTSNTF